MSDNAIVTAADLIEVVDPTDLDNLRFLLSGNLTNLEVFTRVIETFIPRCYLATEQQMDQVANAIIDLFEELDSDADGLITWADFISFYSEAAEAHMNVVHQTLPKAKLVFEQIQQESNHSSGKTGSVLISSAIPNNASIKDIKGNRIEEIQIYNDQYYIVTDLAVYKTDAQFLFCDILFEPTLQVIKGNRGQRHRRMPDQKTKEKEEKFTLQRLENFGIDTSKIDFHSGPKMPTKKIKFDRQAFLNAQNEKDITQASCISCSEILEPLPLLVVCLEEPLFFFVSLSGTPGNSEPIRLSSMASTLCWCNEKETLYIGHENGVVSAYKISLEKKQHGIIQQLEEMEAQELKSKDSISILKKMLSDRHCGLQDLTREDWISAYPDLRELTFDIDEDNERLQEKLALRQQMQHQIQEIMHLRSEDVEITHLITSKIFNPNVSTMDNHGIRLSSLVQEDPIAYFEAMTLYPNPLETAIKKRKYGGVQIYVNTEYLYSKYVVEECVRKLSGGFGHWESERDDAYRLVIAGGGGTITVCDEFLNTVTTFPELHEDGIINTFTIFDNIISVGYHNVYLIDSSAIRQAYLGNCILPDIAPDLSTTELGTQSRRAAEKVQITDAQLLKGEKVKTQSRIRMIEPPRPGFPIITAFQLGNIIGIVDHDMIITLFHGISGAHITRGYIEMPISKGLKFGSSTYHFEKDVGYLPIGMQLLEIKAVSNEPEGENTAVWNILESIEEAEQNRENDKEVEKVSQSIEIGSISKNLIDLVVNQQMNEFAVVTGDYEITFYNLTNGRPEKVINILDINRQLSENLAEKQLASEYHTIETNDSAGQFTENYVAASVKNVELENPEHKEPVVQQKDANELLDSTRKMKSSIPKYLDPIEQLKNEEAENLISILGERILGLQTDIKSRILFVIGTKGIIALYWKTGCLFDYTEISVLGKNLQVDEASAQLESSIQNPFTKENATRQSMMQIEPSSSLAGYKAYSLNVDLSTILLQNNETPVIENVSRQLITASDQNKHLMFIYDLLNPKYVRVLNTAPVGEFSAGQINTRIVFNININYAEAVMDPMFKLKNKLSQYFKSNDIFMLKQKGYAEADRMLYFLPDCIIHEANKQEIVKSINYTPFVKRYLTDCLNLSKIEELSDISMVTAISVSKELQLLAIGTTDARVELFDTSSAKFLRQGVIYLPVDTSNYAVQEIVFLASLPLVFITLSGGFCFIYSVRPLLPSNILICAFKNSSYAPYKYPCNYSPYAHFIKRSRHMQHFLSFLLEDAMTYQDVISQQNEFIKQLCFFYAPDLKNSVLFANDNAISETDNIFLKQQLNLQRSMAQSSLRKSSVGQQNTSLNINILEKMHVQQQQSTLAQSQTVHSGNVFVSMPISRLSVSTAGNTDAPHAGQDDDDRLGEPEEPEKAPSSIPSRSAIPPTPHLSQHALSDSKSALKPAGAADEYTARLLQIAQTLFCFRTPTGASNIILPLQYRNRVKKTILKLRAATLVAGSVLTVFGDFLRQRQLLKCSKTASDFYQRQRRPQAEQQIDVMSLIQVKGAIPAHIQREVQISSRSKKVISDHLKSRFYKQQQEEEKIKQEMEMPERLSVAEKMELQAERKGYLLKRKLVNGKEVFLPVRKMALEALQNNLPAVSAFYLDGKLFTGDDQGFVQQYSVQKLIQALAVKPISLKTKVLKESLQKEPQIINLGFKEQYIDKQLLSSENSGKSMPLLPAYPYVTLTYSMKCADSAISRLQPLKSGNFLTVSDSRRVCVFSMKNCALQGYCQRVRLPDPPRNWQHVFGNECAARSAPEGAAAKQQESSQKQLSLKDLEPAENTRPLSRIEAPPPCAYEWQYLPASDYRDTVSSSAISYKSDKVLEETRLVLSQELPVETYESDTRKSILMQTGLNPRVMDNNLNSWTVKALLLKASNGKTDGSKGGQSVLNEMSQSLSVQKTNMDNISYQLPE